MYPLYVIQVFLSVYLIRNKILPNVSILFVPLCVVFLLESLVLSLLVVLERAFGRRKFLVGELDAPALVPAICTT